MIELIAWSLLALLADAILLLGLVVVSDNFAAAVGSHYYNVATLPTRILMALTLPAWIAIGLAFVVFADLGYTFKEFLADLKEYLNTIARS